MLEPAPLFFETQTRGAHLGPISDLVGGVFSVCGSKSNLLGPRSVYVRTRGCFPRVAAGGNVTRVSSDIAVALMMSLRAILRIVTCACWGPTPVQMNVVLGGIYEAQDKANLMTGVDPLLLANEHVVPL